MQGSQPLLLLPATTMVSPSNQSITALGSPSIRISFVNRNHSVCPQAAGNKGGRGAKSWKLPGKGRGVKPPCSKAKDEPETWLSHVYVCEIAIWEYWKARRKPFWLGQSV